MPLPRALKTDESFLEKIANGATGTRRTFEDLRRQRHDPLELERGSMSFKIWKAIKIKRVRVPDLLCLQCGRRVESRAKTKVEISMSHSHTARDRGWDFGLEDADQVAIVPCRRIGDGPLDWEASPLVPYIRVEDLREAWRQGRTTAQQPKGAQEGFEVRITWPAAFASASGVVEESSADRIRYRSASGRPISVRLQRRHGNLTPLVTSGDSVQPDQVLASVVPVTTQFPCPRGADIQTYVDLSSSASLSDRYTATKALGRFAGVPAHNALTERMRDSKEHIFVRVEAAAGLMRRGGSDGARFLAATLNDDYLENRLEAAIVLGEVATPDAAQQLIGTLQDAAQNAEIRAGAAWALGEVGARAALPALVESFGTLEPVIKIEAARALAKIARRNSGGVIQTLTESPPELRPGIAWAISKAGGFTVDQILPALVDDDARHWVAYVIGTQSRDTMLHEIEALALRDPEVYFAVTVLWKIIASWVYGLEEY